jgi:hypothetical protein
MQKIFIPLAVILLFGCGTTAKQKESTSSVDTTQQATSKIEALAKTKLLRDEEELTRKESEDRDRLDSLRFSKVLTRALQYAEKNKGKSSFTHAFDMFPDDTSYEVKGELIFGNLFAPDRKHLLVRRIVSWGAICNVFLLEYDKFQNLIELERLDIPYVGDTIKDVNGDSFMDFLVHSYPSAGCCRRDTYTAFLYEPETGRFTGNYTFINPTFFPDEKIIRGVMYGHPGEVGLYKYKWNGPRVDTIEFIYPYIMEKGKFIKTTSRKNYPTEKDGLILKTLPDEYQKIESIEYFLHY